jgi:hypothetical protein
MKLAILPDREKAKALRKMASISMDRLSSLDQEKYPSNSINDYYDIIHKLMESFSLENGVKFKGDGAHQQLIDHLLDEGVINQEERVFLQELRDYRNKIAYEGFMISEDYLVSNKDLILTIIKKLRVSYE